MNPQQKVDLWARLIVLFLAISLLLLLLVLTPLFLSKGDSNIAKYANNNSITLYSFLAIFVVLTLISFFKLKKAKTDVRSQPNENKQSYI